MYVIHDGGDNVNLKEVEEVRKESSEFVQGILKNLSNEQLAVAEDGISLGVALANVLATKAKVPKRTKKKGVR